MIHKTCRMNCSYWYNVSLIEQTREEEWIVPRQILEDKRPSNKITTRGMNKIMVRKYLKP